MNFNLPRTGGVTRKCWKVFIHQHRLKSFYVTTPIYYVNSSPHVGHLYTTTLAHTYLKWRKLRDPYTSVCMATGTDEHGLKVAEAAAINNTDVSKYCDKVSKTFRKMNSVFDVTENVNFIRTTESRHKNAVVSIWNTLLEKGYIYKGSYKGWYCVSDEAFLPESQVEKVTDPKTGLTSVTSIESGNTVEWMVEENYMFKLSEMLPRVMKWIENNPDVIHPPKYRDILLNHLSKYPKQDLSVSREADKVLWGIPVPGDPSHSIYVWLDALTNYLTVAGYPDKSFSDVWPADVHLVGMDILKFHAIYWPAFLIAAGLELPKRIVVHSHWTMNNTKMSKSKGNVVDPVELTKHYDPYLLKYFLLRQGVLEHNCDFSEDLLKKVANADLANVLGNCLNRATAKKLNPEQIYPHFDSAFCESGTVGNEELEYITLVERLPAEINHHFERFHFYEGLFEIMQVVREANMIIVRHQLWNMTSEQDALKQNLLYLVYEGLRVGGILLQPILPELSTKLLDKLGISKTDRTWACANQKLISSYNSSIGNPLGTSKKVLFRNIKV